MCRINLINIIGCGHINEKKYVRQVDDAIVEQGRDNDVILNSETLMKIVVAKQDFPLVYKVIFETGATKMEDVEENTVLDVWKFSRESILKVSYPVPDRKLKDSEEHLTKKYTARAALKDKSGRP